MKEDVTKKTSESPANAKGEVVVYQPDETMRLEKNLMKNRKGAVSGGKQL